MSSRTFVTALLLALLGAAGALASAGIPDRVPAATLIVPMFRTGVNPTTDPDDTLLIVQNVYINPVMFHFHYWDVHGNAVGLYGNVTLTPKKTWSVATRDLLNAASSAVRTSLLPLPGISTRYEGFVTIDVVTASTTLNPRQAGYPFDTTNALEGFIYYTRLSKGSANGMAMVPIEEVGTSGISGLLQGFYGAFDGREEIDADARQCNDQMDMLMCLGDQDGKFRRIDFRSFGSTPLNGKTEWVIFAWSPELGVGGPSTLCANPTWSCDTTYPMSVQDETGAVTSSGTVSLDRVVTVFGDASLWVSGFGTISYVPSVHKATQLYAFSLNSASPSSDPNLTWDAIFEAYIQP